mmetsp:Transcript_5444/g.17462  ORF Transcript_5444/g.17462 Transcript_5444/m.17462 type:complete len:131 (-) Transcript_5444:148-540(-)
MVSTTRCTQVCSDVNAPNTATQSQPKRWHGTPSATSNARSAASSLETRPVHSNANWSSSQEHARLTGEHARESRTDSELLASFDGHVAAWPKAPSSGRRSWPYVTMAPSFRHRVVVEQKLIEATVSLVQG